MWYILWPKEISRWLFSNDFVLRDELIKCLSLLNNNDTDKTDSENQQLSFNYCTKKFSLL